VEHSKAAPKAGLVLGNRMTALSQGIELIELTLIEFLRKIPLLELFLKQFPSHVFDDHIQLWQEHLPS
jgi:hypothetical protein